MRVIAVIMSTAAEYDREVLRGIGRVAKVERDWRLRTIDPRIDIDRVVSDWRPAGAVGRLLTADRAAALRAAGIPAVSTSHSSRLRGVPRVGFDDRGIGRLAAKHLQHLGLRQFAFVGVNMAFSHERLSGYRSALAEAGMSCSALPGHPVNAPPLREWLGSLPKPVGVFACHDLTALEVSEACQDTGLRVPDDVAIVGVDNDELICELAIPPLSSIAVPGRRVGELAAEWLARLLEGKAAPRRAVRLPPLRVVARGSTDVLAVRSPELAAAIRFIRDNADRPIRVADVLTNVPVSRRAIEQQFRRELGRSPLAEIRNAHIRRAEELLLGTDLPLQAVAEASGMVSRERLSVVFRQVTGHTPAAYRRQFGSWRQRLSEHDEPPESSET